MLVLVLDWSFFYFYCPLFFSCAKATQSRRSNRKSARMVGDYDNPEDQTISHPEQPDGRNHFWWQFHPGTGTYVNIYHVAQGDVKFGAEIQAYAVAIGTIISFAAIPVLTYLSSRIGKIKTLGISISALLLGSILKWFCYTPAMPYLQLIVQPFVRIGEMGFWLIITSMKADICDWDEWKTGFRREGMYGAATGWFQKVTQATTFALGQGYILAIIGFDATKGVAQDPV